EGCAVYMVDKKSCEGCAACAIVCPTGSIKFKTAINGEWFVSDTRFGPMSHAKLGAAEENSGKLVTLIRNKKNQLAAKNNINLSIIDGSPGTGCPVIASITGTDYAVIVTEPTVSGVHDLKRVLDVIKFFGIKSGVVVNKFDLNIDKANDIIAIAKEYGADFLGKIGYDKSVTKAQIKGLSVIEFTDSKITDEIKDIWQKIKENVNVW
ncbi:MAG TPA: 4Fe-4S binding protein, partial [Spirochaetota bacterium]|nr:4Fe-4S binding protein [Spirochaetota bacterium]